MSSTKDICIAINIKPTQLNNVDNSIMSFLNENYVGKCIKNVLIVSILQINKRSNVIATNFGHYQVSVEFKASIIHYERGDIIPLLKIELVSDEFKSIVGKTEHDISAIINLTEQLTHLKKDMYIPIVIDLVEYNFGNGSAICGRLMNFAQPFYYKLTGDAIDVKISDLTFVSTAVKKNLIKFDNLIVNKNIKENKKIGKLVEFEKFKNLKKDDIIFRPLYMSRFDCCYVIKESELIANGLDYISKEPQIIFSLIKKEYELFTDIYTQLDSQISNINYLAKCYE